MWFPWTSAWRKNSSHLQQQQQQQQSLSSNDSSTSTNINSSKNNKDEAALPPPKLYSLLWNTWTQRSDEESYVNIVDWDKCRQDLMMTIIRHDDDYDDTCTSSDASNSTATTATMMMKSISQYRHPDSGLSILHLVCAVYPPLDVVQFFVQQNPSSLLYQSYHKGWTPFHIACGRNASLDVITYMLHQLLQMKNSDKDDNAVIDDDDDDDDELVQMEDSDGYNALHWACRPNVSYEICDTLLQHVPALATLTTKTTKTKSRQHDNTDKNSMEEIRPLDVALQNFVSNKGDDNEWRKVVSILQVCHMGNALATSAATSTALQGRIMMDCSVEDTAGVTTTSTTCTICSSCATTTCGTCGNDSDKNEQDINHDDENNNITNTDKEDFVVERQTAFVLHAALSYCRLDEQSRELQAILERVQLDTHHIDCDNDNNDGNMILFRFHGGGADEKDLHGHYPLYYALCQSPPYKSTTKTCTYASNAMEFADILVSQLLVGAAAAVPPMKTTGKTTTTSSCPRSSNLPKSTTSTSQQRHHDDTSFRQQQCRRRHSDREEEYNTYLHLALSHGWKWDGGISTLCRAYPNSISIPDTDTGLYPFQLAAAAATTIAASSSSSFSLQQQVANKKQCENDTAAAAMTITTIYSLLKQDPSLLL